MFQRIQNLFPRAFNRLGLGRQMQAAIICEKYRKLAAETVHPDVLTHTIPKFYKQKVLTIAVENAAWGYTVIQKKTALIKAINDSCGGPMVKDIRTRVEILSEKIG